MSDSNKPRVKDAPGASAAPSLRQRAEAALVEQAAQLPGNSATPSPEAMQQTLHELHVHQIELEMQNEELRRAQVELEAARARYFDLYDLAPVGYCTLSEPGLILQANLAAAAMLGVARGSLINQAISRFIRKEDEGIYYQLRQQLLQSGEPRSCELRMSKKDGAVLWAHLVASIAQDAVGAPVLRVVLSDVSARKHAEAALRTLSRAVEQSPSSIMITDASGTIEYVNPRYEEVTGYSKAEVLGHNPRLLQSGKTPPETYSDLWQAISAGGEWRGELCNRRKNGELFWEFAAISGLRDEDGRITQYIGVKEDITARKEAEAARLRLEAQLRESQKMEALGTLAGGVAHDFNNVLLTIMGNVELACMDAEPGHASLRRLDEIRKAAYRAKALVQQILAFGRRQAVALAPIALTPAVEESVRLLRAALPAHLSLSLECAPDAPVVLADAMHIEQALLNLVNNAWQAPEGRAKPKTIAIRLSGHVQSGPAARDPRVRYVGKALAPGRYARLTVSDNAAGMDLATLGHLFEPFFTTKPVGEGTGLGLSVVFGIAQEHGASIEVHSTPGAGSAFHLYFPAAGAQADVAPAPGVRAPLAAQVRASGGQGKHILYIDDDDSVLRVMTQLLGREGYRVSAYSDGHKALEAARADPGQYDLAVTDFSMPRISGMEVAKALLAMRADLPVAILTGYATETLVDEARAIGVREVIPKPNSFDELMESIARLAHESDAKQKAS